MHQIVDIDKHDVTALGVVQSQVTGPSGAGLAPMVDAHILDLRCPLLEFFERSIGRVVIDGDDFVFVGRHPRGHNGFEATVDIGQSVIYRYDDTDFEHGTIFKKAKIEIFSVLPEKFGHLLSS